MSLLCLYVIEGIEKKSEVILYTKQIEELAKHYKCGVKFCVDWPEPIISTIKNDSFIVNILDSPDKDNCELFLLPDGWYTNGKTNDVVFRERMKFLYDITVIFENMNYSIDLYLGQSGTYLDEYFNITLKKKDLVDYLSKNFSSQGLDSAIHINLGK